MRSIFSVRPPAQISKRIAGLDGLRALAILTVVLCHIQQRFVVLPFSVPAPDGVALFFVLSGFLITTLLLREQDAAGTISVRRFYGRRARRILPPLLVYLAIVILVCVLAGSLVPWSAIASAALLTGGLSASPGSAFTEHIWSLGVEEQFYLAWPLLLTWAIRHGGRGMAAFLALLCIAAAPLCRLAMLGLHSPLLAHKQGMILPGRMDSLCAGCLVAVCVGNPQFERLFHGMRRVWWFAPAFFFLLSPWLRASVGNAYTFTAGYTLEALAMAYFIVWVTRSPASLVGRALSWKPIAFLGLVSYSTYLYQSILIHAWPGQSWNTRPGSVLAAVFLAGIVTFYLVEWPLARLFATRPIPALPAKTFDETFKKQLVA